MSPIKPFPTVAAAPAPSPAGDPALKKAAHRFEAIFVRQMIGSMRQAGPGDELLGSSATDAFRELADARTADNIASMGQFGIAQMIERQLAARGGAK